MQTVTANRLVQELLGNWPPPSPNGMDPIEFSKREAIRLKGLITVMSEFDEIDVRQAISDFILGKVRNLNPAFAPTAPQLATQIRHVRDKRLDADRWDRISQQNAETLLPPPERTEESRERVAKMIEDFTRRNKPEKARSTFDVDQGSATEWLKDRQRRLVAAGIEKTEAKYPESENAAPDPVSGEIYVTPQLREILARERNGTA